MLGYYAMFIAATLVTQVNSVYIYKKYQLTAGTSLPASVLYMIINGIVSAIVPAIVIATTKINGAYWVPEKIAILEELVQTELYETIYIDEWYSVYAPVQ